MAVLDSVPGLVVEVIVDGQPVEEYPDQDNAHQESKKKSMYTEARSHSHFAVKCTFSTRIRERFSVELYIDGKWVDERGFPPKQRFPHVHVLEG